LKRFLIIESKQPIHSDESVILTMFESFLDMTHVGKDTHQMIIYYQNETDIQFKDIILNMMSDILSDLRIYVSHRFESLEELEAHLIFIQKYMKSINFNQFVYLDDKVILKTLVHEPVVTYKKIFLRKYATDHHMIETIKTYLECNQNMSEAAKELYMHRNTLIQRIDKFHQITGFDVKKFNDAFLIYHLIK